MSKVEPIDKNLITPRAIIDAIKDRIDIVREIYVVEVMEDDDGYMVAKVSAAGDTKGMALASGQLMRFALDTAQGDR